MQRDQIIKNLKDEERRAVVMGCTADYIETIKNAIIEVSKVNAIDALINDSVLDCEEIVYRIRGLL